MSMKEHAYQGLSAIGVAACAACLLSLPIAAAAADELAPLNDRNKAQVEHTERQVASTPAPNKGQIEHREASLPVSSVPDPVSGASRTPDVGVDEGFVGALVGWQLGVGAVAGAVVTSTAVAGTRQIRRHRSAVA